MRSIDTISAPILDNLIAQAQLHPDLLSQAEKDRLLEIIGKLQCVAICGNDECRELWITAERGFIEDFGDYDEYLENGEVKNREDFEKIWQDYYPNPVKWYLFSVSYYNKEYYISIDSKLTIHIKARQAEINKSFNNPLILWFEREVDKCIDWLKKDMVGYNQYINQHLPFVKRTGRILRQQYWEIDPEEKEWMLKGLTIADIDTLRAIAELSENEERVVFLDRMTSGIFFDCCKMGYDANNYPYDAESKPVDLYRKFADGRDFGLTQLNPKSRFH